MHTDVAQWMDKTVLHLMNRRIPPSLETSAAGSLPWAEVLAQTAVNRQQTAVTQLAAPGTHAVYLNTPEGEICCRVKVHLAPDPAAPLLIYHHGLGEYPYDSSWRRLFAESPPPSLHRVLVQAPYHTSWASPLSEGFRRLQSIYQMLAGSLRIMALVQDFFENQGSPSTILAGVSWGGITSLVYEGQFQRVRAVVPMLASPNIAQSILDIAHLVGRPLSIAPGDLLAHLDFTPVYRQIGNGHVYPLLGRHDLFFRWEHHAPLFRERPLVTVPGSHLTNLWQIGPLRQHLYRVLAAVTG